MITVTTKKDITVDHQYREVPMEVIGFGEKEINMYNLMKIGILVWVQEVLEVEESEKNSEAQIGL